MVVLVAYFVLQRFVPVKDFLIDHILKETAIVQQHSTVRPKWHIMSDSVTEMVTVGKDALRHRTKLKDSDYYHKSCGRLGCNLLCKRALCFPCCKHVPSSFRVLFEARDMMQKEFDLIRLVKRLRQTEGLIYAMTTKS